LFEEIGHGGMATVYRAHDNRLGRDVAVKVIHRHLRENKEVAARFASEARAVAKVKHPNIVEVYDVSSEEDPERYLVVELIRGTTLRKVLVEHGHLPAEIAAAIGIQIARGLNHAHQQGVVHRDVKPENVMIASRAEGRRRIEGSPTLRVKITDFGIAKLLDAQGVTSTGQVLGSPAHMAPEQIEGGDVSARADVFGLGVLLYECMVGALPFDGKNPAQVLRRVLDGNFTPPERARPSVGAAWSRIVEKALAHSPEDRYASTGDLADAMEAELTTLGFADPAEELEAFLDDTEAYEEAYCSRIVGSLTELGRQARLAHEMPRAAGLFNRALAFRPDNTELLAEVAGLARRQRFRRTLRTGVMLGGGVLAVVTAGLIGFQQFTNLEASEPTADDTRVHAGEPDRSPFARQSSPPRKMGRAPAASGTVERAAVKRTSRLARPKPARSEPDLDQVRAVRIVIDGPQSATVRIDGQVRPWYEPQQLSVGPHTFEFIPPNTDCCEHPPPRTVQVLAGDGVQVVKGHIPFKPANLSLEAPPGAKASCGVAGQLLPGETRRIELDDASLSVRCHVIPPPESGASPKEIDVALAPGRTFSIAWP
jgi:serine/threonine-protein kinase